MALETLRKLGAKGGNHVLDADIRDYFGSIDHDKLMKLVARRVSDPRLGLELHPEKTRKVVLAWGQEGFDFLGCHLHKRLSGIIWERARKRICFLQRWPSQRSMQRIRQRVKELTSRSRCHADIREIISDLNPVLRGWGNYFRTGNAATRFNQLDSYVWRRLRSLRVKRKGRNLRPGELESWSRGYPEQPFFKEAA